VGALLRKWGIADRVERAAAAARWDEVVGPEIARRTSDPTVRGRTLFVEVESASWMQELDMRRHRILAELNEGLREGEIEKIVFHQAGRRRPPEEG
jgi:predicted nucleic acid-binding Zn ribbon protein